MDHDCLISLLIKIAPQILPLSPLVLATCKILFIAFSWTVIVAFTIGCYKKLSFENCELKKTYTEGFVYNTSHVRESFSKEE